MVEENLLSFHVQFYMNNIYVMSSISRFAFVKYFRIGVVEKGQAVVVLSVNGTPGHSSFPPFETPIGILSAAVHK